MSSQNPITSLAQLYEALERHDWFHEMSDDHGVWERGSADWKRLGRVAKQLGPKAEQLVVDYHKYVCTNKTRSTTLVSKPNLENYL